SSGRFDFNPQAPGPYELCAFAQGNARYRTPDYGAYLPLSLDRDQTELRVPLAAVPELRVSVEDPKGVPVDPRTFQVAARRKDLSGDGKPESLRLTSGRAQLPPGRWDLMLTPTSGYYVSGFTGPPDDFGRVHPEGW